MDSPSVSAFGTIKPRRSQVYVEIPSSPFVARFPRPNLKENASPKISLPLSAKMSPLKRKIEEQRPSSSKKFPKKLKQSKSNDTMKKDAPCHHCRKRKPLTYIVQCTRLRNSGSRCRASYCDICLHKRYGVHLDALKNQPSAGPERGHISENYIFSCPRCDGRCTCGPCRKKGSLTCVVDNNVVFISTGSTNVDPLVDYATKPKPLRKKPLAPEPLWVRLPVQYSRKELEDRLYIREFVLRFNPILNIGVKNLEELDDPMALHDSSTKAILLALLDIIAAEEETNVKEIKQQLKVLQGLGLNWAKITPVIEGLRSLVPLSHPFYSLPAVIKTTDSSYNMRGDRSHGIDANSLLPMLLHLINQVCNGGSVREELEVGSEQIRKARSEYHLVLREENEKWNETKESLMARKPLLDKKELSSHEWTNQYREAEAKYKEKVDNLQNYFRLESCACASRFEPLGTDADGRVYYLPSSLGPFRGKKDRVPSPNERLNFRKWSWFIAVYGKPGAEMQHTDFDYKLQLNPLDSENAMPKEGWWGFADISEMRKLSKWLASRVTVEKENAGDAAAEGILPKAVANEMKLLAKDIAEFAEFAEWRLKRTS